MYPEDGENQNARRGVRFKLSSWIFVSFSGPRSAYAESRLQLISPEVRREKERRGGKKVENITQFAGISFSTAP